MLKNKSLIFSNKIKFFLIFFYILGISLSFSQDYVDSLLDLTGLDILQSNSQIQNGARVYNLVCADCHGDTGLGIEEGIQGFHPEHQYCQRCHKTFNAPTKAMTRLSQRNSFDLGVPPPLRDENSISKFQNAFAYYSYIKATMPRYDPDGLTEQEYWDMTAFLIALNKKLPTDTILDIKNAAQITLH